MIPTDVKANKNKKKKKDLVAVSYKYLQNLKYSVKKIASYIFHLILVGILAAHFDIVCYKQGVVGGGGGGCLCLTDKIC